VTQALQRWAKQHPTKMVDPLTGLECDVAVPPAVEWNSLGGHYFFYANGMYHGVELDGYIHT